MTTIHFDHLSCAFSINVSEKRSSETCRSRLMQRQCGIRSFKFVSLLGRYVATYKSNTRWHADENMGFSAIGNSDSCA